MCSYSETQSSIESILVATCFKSICQSIFVTIPNLTLKRENKLAEPAAEIDLITIASHADRLNGDKFTGSMID